MKKLLVINVLPEKQIRLYNLVGKHISRFFMGHIAKKLGCKTKLDAKPYAACLSAARQRNSGEMPNDR